MHFERLGAHDAAEKGNGAKGEHRHRQDQVLDAIPQVSFAGQRDSLPPAHGQPAQPHGKDQQQQQAHPVDRHRAEEHRKDAHKVVKKRAAIDGAEHTQRHADQQRDEQADQSQFQRGPHAIGHPLPHRLFGVDARAQVAAQDAAARVADRDV
jgi:hypothetical protein